jgi:hypothetical protein
VPQKAIFLRDSFSQVLSSGQLAPASLFSLRETTFRSANFRPDAPVWPFTERNLRFDPFATPNQGCKYELTSSVLRNFESAAIQAFNTASFTHLLAEAQRSCLDRFDLAGDPCGLRDAALTMSRANKELLTVNSLLLANLVLLRRDAVLGPQRYKKRYGV